ncbi:MAG: hypothetical protein GF421_01025 [Candidatus Aminicenantes bacterium]|nr:hypothetical protein [Candidatus Aminicenantes bacterium]
MSEFELKKTINDEQMRFYLKSCKHYRFPFFDPRNCYRKIGLFDKLEETLVEIGETMQKEMGDDFISINLRGSWLRGIPIEGDDVDVLFVVNGLTKDQKQRILDYSRKVLAQKDPLFRMCEGKVEAALKVEPITFLDLKMIPPIMNKYMYGLEAFIRSAEEKARDTYQDLYFGSKLTEKKSEFLKSGILIPYVGWIYGADRKKEVFNEIAKFLPIPTKKVSIYSKLEIEEAKETLRQAFIARNLIYPSLDVKKGVHLSEQNVQDYKKQAIALYKNLAALEDVFARAVVNYLYTIKIEDKLLGERLTPDRIQKFSPTYDQLVYDIVEKAFLRKSSKFPPEA